MTETDSRIHSGIDLSFRAPDIRAQDDLFAHVNGRWLAEHEIPADRSVDGAFRVLCDRAEEQVRAILEEAASGNAEPGSDECKIGDLYAGFMDVESVAAAGLDPIADELAAVRAAGDRDQLAALIGSLQRVGVGGVLRLYVDTDEADSQRYLLNLGQSGLGLPDESYYRENGYAEIRAAYRDHIATMFGLAEVDYDADRVVELERKLAAGHWDVVKRRDAELGYNPTAFSELVATHQGFNWNVWAEAVAAGVDGSGVERFATVGVRQPGFVGAFATLWTGEALADWQAWLTWRILHARAPYLTEALVVEDFEFYGRRLSGAPELRLRWKRGVEVVEKLLGEAVGKLYVARHFPPESKARMVELVANLEAAYRRNITDLDWMSADTKQSALAKLEKFVAKIGYPDDWRDYSGVRIERADPVGNYRRGYAADHDRDLAKLGGPVDRTEWFMTPQTVNAYYNPGMNEIVFPAAILQPPFFDPDADDAANYGGIGAVIGHEIGHGFDDQGSKYDGDGNMVDWWSDKDRAEFGKRTAALIEQYNGFSPSSVPDHHVNGAFTIGENIGDLGGLSIALVAYSIALDGREAPVINGLTGLQRVFFGWAQVWRTLVRKEETIRRLAVDPHSPPEFRCNGVVRNVDAFYEAFDVAPGDGLYLDPSARIRIW